MPYTVEDFIRNAKQDIINILTIDDVLKKRYFSKSKHDEIEAYLKELKQNVR